MKDQPSVRSSQLYQILNGKVIKSEKYRLFDWEPLLDALIAFYDVCCTHEAQKRDKYVSNFVKKHKNSIEEIKTLRICKEDFDIIKTIGRGHFGEVHVVKEIGSGDIYAMKILKKSSTLSQDNMAFFEEERDIMAFANSPWVTGLQYAFQDAENLYLVMEFHPGGDLLTLLQRYENGVMEEDDARFYMGEIIMAVHAVHVIGYVHRDVKPENILLDMTGHLKLADFGSSAHLISGRSVICKMPVGTPEYIAPEVLMSMNSGGGVYGSECDWWSVGVVAYEMMCGCLPFEADGVLKLYSQIMDFKNSLCFPDDVKMSENAVHLITNLLEDQKTRLNYTQLATHDFFKNMDWTTLKSVTPPYIPELKDSCDTSHFGDFKTTKIASKDSTYSLGNTLPFLGFTFTRQIYQSQVSEHKNKLPSHSNSSAADNEGDKPSSDVLKEFTKLQQSHDQLNSTLEALKKTCSDHEKKSKKLETENAALVDESKSNASTLKETVEKLSCLKSENDNLKKEINKFLNNNDGITDLKAAMEAMKGELEIEKKTISELKNEKSTTESKIKTLKEELELSTKKCLDSETYWKEYEKIQLKTQLESKESVKELQSLLEKTSHDYQEKLKLSLDDSSKYRVVVEELQNKITLLEKENQSNKALLSSMPSKEKTVCEIDVGPSYIACLKEENSKMKSELEKYEETKKKLAALDSELTIKQGELDSKEITILKLNQSIRLFENQMDQETRKSKENERLIAANNEKMQGFTTSINKLTLDIEQLKALIVTKDDEIKKINELNLKYKKEIESNSNQSSSEDSDKIKQELAKSSALLVERSNEILNLKVKLVDIQASYNEENALKKKQSEEIERLTSLISTQKISNFSLSQQIEELINKNRNLAAENEEISSKIDRLNVASKENIFKLQSTIAQQNKLINFLHDERLKKPKGGKMDPDKTISSPPGLNTITYGKARDLEHQLELERGESLRLNTELTQLRKELAKHKSLDGHRTKSPYPSFPEEDSSTKSSSHQDKDSGLHSSKRLSENLSVSDSNPALKSYLLNPLFSPLTTITIHSFHQEICSIPTICPICWVPIPLFHSLSRCSKCKISSHTSCEGDMPNFNCSPCPEKPYIVDLVNPLHLENIFLDFDPEKVTLPLKGWLSIPHKIAPNKYDWNKKWFILSETRLDINNNVKDEVEKIGSVEFSTMKTQCILHPAIHTSDVAFATTISSYPLIFGLEISANDSQKAFLDAFQLVQSTDKSNQNIIIYMMVSTLSEKRLWIRAFENALSKYISREPSLSLTSTISFDSSKVNCIQSITNITDDNMLIAGLGGIFFYPSNENNIFPCFNSPITCYYISFKCEFLFGIVGEKRTLVRLMYDKSKKISKMSSKNCHLAVNNIFDVHDCYCINTMDVTGDTCILVAIRIDEILLIKMAFDSSSYKLQKIPMDPMPSSLIRMENTLLLCQDRFYTYDIATAKKTEFLDKSDNSLAFMMFGSNGCNNFPMSIFPLNRSATTPEFLICCSEFGFVVDIKGRRTLNRDLRWDQIPVSFHFQNNKLYICYSLMIEVRQFWNDLENDIHTSSRSITKYIVGPKVLGFSLGNDAITICGVNNDLSISLYKYGNEAINLKRNPSIKGSKTEVYTGKDQSENKAALTHKGSRLFSRKKK